MDKILNRIYKITTILFFIGIVIFFIGSLSLMTELFLLVDYQSYLRPEALILYNTAKDLNRVLFDVATYLVVIGSFTMFFKLYRKQIKLIAFIYLIISIVLTIILTGIYSLELFDLFNLYHATDISWNSNANQELLRYTEPSDYWIVFTLASTLISFITSVISLPVTITYYLKLRKPNGEVV